MGQVDIGILGAASIAGRALVTPSKEVSALFVKGAASRDREKGGEFVLTHRLPVLYSTYEELLKDPGLDAVYIPLNNSSHFAWVTEALKAGKHVLVEKPLCIDMKELEAILSALDGRVLLEGVMTSHHPWQEYIRNQIEKETWGKLVSTETVMNTLYQDYENYRYQDRRGGGVFYDLGSYWLEFIQNIIPGKPDHFEVSRITGYENRLDQEAEIEALYHGGIRAKFSASFNKNFKAQHKLNFEKAAVTVRNFLACAVGTNKLILKVETGEETSKIKFEPENYYVNQLNRFVSLISEGNGNFDDLEKYRERIEYQEKIISQIRGRLGGKQ